jgi:hypothetical protein
VRRRDGWALSAIAACTLALYAPVLGYGFVYDDHWTIVNNPGLGAPLARVLRALLHGQAGRLSLADKTRPTMVLSMWIDRRLFGLAPGAFHAHSLLLYLGVVVVAWLALRVLLGRPRAALLGALFFALAPLHAEVVACVNYREDLLVAVNALAVVALFFAPRRWRPPRARALEIAAVAACTLLALGAKESGFVIPLLLAAVAWARRDDIPMLRRRDGLVVALVVTTLVFLNWRISVPDDVPRAHDPGLLLRALATARYEVRAVGASFAPFFWSPERAHPAPAAALWLLPFGALLALLVWLRRTPRGRPFAVALAFALVAPLASCPLALPANELADRYVFLGSVGGAIAFGTLVDAGLGMDRELLRRAAVAVAAVVLGVAAVVAFQARSVFRSDDDLWAAAVARAPDSPRAWTGLSHVLRLRGRLSDADDADARALALDPSYAPAKLTHVYNLLARGELDEARARRL